MTDFSWQSSCWGRTTDLASIKMRLRARNVFLFIYFCNVSHIYQSLVSRWNDIWWCIGPVRFRKQMSSMTWSTWGVLYEASEAFLPWAPCANSAARSARRQIDGGSNALRGQEHSHGRGHTHARLHIRRAVQTATTLAAKCHWAVFVGT